MNTHPRASMTGHHGAPGFGKPQPWALHSTVLLLFVILTAAGILRTDNARAVDLDETGLLDSRVLTPAFLDRELLDEAWRRGDLDRSQAVLFPRDRGDALHLLSASPWKASLFNPISWPHAPVATFPLGFSASADVKILGFAANPPRQLHPLYQDVRSGDLVDPAWRIRVGFWLDTRLTGGLSGHLRFVFDSEGMNDPHNRTRDFSQLGASNNLDEAYLRYQSRKVSVTLGRRFLDWGPDRFGSLILSSTAPAVDMIHGEIRLGKHRLQAFAGQLSDETVWARRVLGDSLPGGDTTFQEQADLRRTLYGHRIDFSLWSWGRLGLSETAVVATEAGGFDLKYANPVSIYAVTQTEDGSGDQTEVNVFHQIDGEAWWRGWHLYGAFLVDDLQIDAEGREKWPDQLAGSVGLDRTLGRRALLSYEYRRLGSWTYLHRGLGTDAQHFERPLGAPEGPDTDRHVVLASWRPSDSTRLWICGERRRRGINRLWTDESRLGHVDEPFPRPPVEKRWIASAGASWRLPPWMRAELQLGWQSVENVDNTDEREDILEVRGYVQLFSPVFAWLMGN